jgi:hypothetical protein
MLVTQEGEASLQAGYQTSVITVSDIWAAVLMMEQQGTVPIGAAVLVVEILS